MNKILVIVHQPTSDPGRIGRLLRDRGYYLDIRVPSQQDELPHTMDDHCACAIFGGPMSANDSETLPFIRNELDWIPVALESGKPLLGICLGAQLLARVLGAVVAPHPEGWMESGYFQIMPTPSGREYFEEPLHVYHWHKEGFELPDGAVLLASGDTFPHQAYRYGKSAFGVQFHPEMTRKMLERWTTEGRHLLNVPGAQSVEEQFQKHSLYASAMERWLDRFLSLWLGKDAISMANRRERNQACA
ncbi:MAG TPA: glutamine amidotransferase [Allocoleopsis sp.]